MNATQNVGIANVALSYPPNGATSSVASPTLPELPAPRTEIDGIQDAMAKLYAVLASVQRDQTKCAESSVKTALVAKKHAERERDEQLAQAKREAEEGGVFKWFSDDIGVLGVIGLATFNYPLVGADLALHKTGLVDDLKLDVLDAAALGIGGPEMVVADVLLRKLSITPEELKQVLDDLGMGKSVPGISDQDVEPIVDKAIIANLMIAGALASVFTAGSTTAIVVACIGLALSGAGMVTQAAGGPEEVALGLQIAGAACSIGSAFVGGGAATASASAAAKTGSSSAGATSKASAAARVAAARTAAKIVNGASAVLNGADKIVVTVHQKASDDANERATAARHALTRLERLLDDVIASLEESQESHKRTAATVQSALQTYNQTQTAVASSMLKG